jgi:hypothetical protein
MGKVYESIDPSLQEFILRQKMFFVATAPLSGDGLVNLSPKGLDTLRILDDRTVAYADLTGLVVIHKSVASKRHRSGVAKRRQPSAGDGNPRCMAHPRTFSAGSAENHGQ